MDIASIFSLFPALAPYAGAIGSVIALNAAIATKLPAPQVGTTGVYPLVYTVVNWAALNFGEARNATAQTTIVTKS